MMSLWDALRMNMMISYQELVRTFPNLLDNAAFRRELEIILKNPALSQELRDELATMMPEEI